MTYSKFKEAIQSAISSYSETPVKNQSKLNEAIAIALDYKNHDQLMGEINNVIEPVPVLPKSQNAISAIYKEQLAKAKAKDTTTANESSSLFGVTYRGLDIHIGEVDELGHTSWVLRNELQDTKLMPYRLFTTSDAINELFNNNASFSVIDALKLLPDDLVWLSMKRDMFISRDSNPLLFENMGELCLLEMQRETFLISVQEK